MCKTRWESFKFCDLVWLILEIYNNFLSSQVVSLLLETGKCSVQTCIKWGQSVLHDAAKWGHTECLRMLLDAGANPDATDRWTNTPLMYATLHGHQECVGWLSIGIISFIFLPWLHVYQLLSVRMLCLVHPGVRDQRRVSEIDLSQPRHETAFWWRHNGPVTLQLTDRIKWPNYPLELIGIYVHINTHTNIS